MQFPGAEEGRPVEIVAQFGKVPFPEHMRARLQRRRGLVRQIGIVEIRPRIFQAEQFALPLARPRIAHMGIVRRGGRHEFLALRIRQQPARHTHRAAGVENVNDRPGIGRIDPQRGVYLAGGRPADQQRHGHVGRLHLFRDGHHLVERGGDQTRQADHVRIVFVRGFEDLGPRHHYAEVDHFISVALQDHADDVLADVVHVTLDRGHDYLALRAGARFLFRLDEGDEMRHGLFHHAGRFDHLRQEHLAAAEKVADDVHAVHQRAFDHLDGPRELLARFFGIGDDMRVDSLDQRMFQPAAHFPAAPLFGRLFVGRTLALVAFGQIDQPLRRIGTAHQDHVLAGLAQHRVDLVVNVQLPGVDDRHVEPGGDRMIEEHRMHRAAHGLVAPETEAQIGEAPARLRMGAARLDLRHRLEEVEAITVMLLDPGRHGENVGVEDDVLGRIADAFQQVVSPRADFDLALLRIGLARLVERHDDHRGPVIHAFARMVQKRVLAFLHADGIDDRLARYAFQPGLDHAPFGTVDHHRDPCDIGFRGDQLEEGRHCLFGVQQAFVHVDVDHLRTVFDLFAGDFDGGFVIVRHDQFLEPGRSGHIGAFADVDEPGGGFVAHDLKVRSSARASTTSS